MGESISAIPFDRWRELSRPRDSPRRPRGLDAMWAAMVSAPARFSARWKTFASAAKAADQRLSTLESISPEDLSARLAEAGQEERRGKTSHQLEIEGLALIAEVARRNLGLRPHVVQLRGALALRRGAIIEMATGEGKTLVAALAAVLEARRGRGCHVITVNDYLAQRDAQWMAPVYEHCGLRVAYVTGSMPADQRRDAYRADVTYVTSKEAAADFLRDLIAGERLGGGGLAQALLAGPNHAREPLIRGLHSVIVDEADSVLIDEAVTPLILSSATGAAHESEARLRADALARSLELGVHFRIDRAHREALLLASGHIAIRDSDDSLAGATTREREEMVSQALAAHHLFEREHHYVIQDQRIVIVDESTGRLMPDRQWRGGLHQAIEAKEGLEIHEPSETLARISFQRFFGLYDRLSGMTGTAREARREFWDVYKRPVISIPTNKPSRRRPVRDRIVRSSETRWRRIVNEARRLQLGGRAVLIGTRSVAASEHLSELLRDANVEHQMLNAVRHADEAQVIAQAGVPGRVTIATNMAGRGTDIKLEPEVAACGGLHVIASERHESRRVDRQLFGRAGRQGDQGSGQAIISLEDDLVGRHARGPVTRLLLLVGARSPAIWRAQRRAQRLARRQRAMVLRDDDWFEDALGFAGAGA